jgi:hypothetical protein
MTPLPITRRAFHLAPLAATAPPPVEFDAELVKRHDDQVSRLLARQVTDTSNTHCGGHPDDYGIFFPGSAAGILEAFASSFHCRQSKYAQSTELLARMRLAASCLKRNQLPSGNFDLPTTNFDSPPDTAFLTLPLANAALLAKRGGDDTLFGLCEPVLRRIAGALLTGGVHTPNHRWVVCEALAQLNELFPDPNLVRRIDQWLGESVDLDEDGQYNERSTTIYNAVTDRALVVIAEKLRRPALLAPVRRNLESMMYLLHPGGEVVTDISRRQDLFERGTLSRYWFPLRYLASADDDGRLATLARQQQSAASLPMTMLYDRLRKPMPGNGGLPADYERAFRGAGAVRIRRGDLSATLLLKGRSRFLSVRNGGCVVEAVRFASAFFGKGQFRPTEWRQEAGVYILEQHLEGPYYQPFVPRRVVEAEAWEGTRGQRPKSGGCILRQSATIREIKGGLEFTLRCEGTDRVPVAVEIALRPGGRLQGAEILANAEDAYVLRSGSARYTLNGNTLRIGPGFAEHTWTQVRGAEPRLPFTSLYLCGFTPLHKTIAIEAA